MNMLPIQRVNVTAETKSSALDTGHFQVSTVDSRPFTERLRDAVRKDWRPASEHPVNADRASHPDSLAEKQGSVRAITSSLRTTETGHSGQQKVNQFNSADALPSTTSTSVKRPIIAGEPPLSKDLVSNLTAPGSKSVDSDQAHVASQLSAQTDSTLTGAPVGSFPKPGAAQVVETARSSNADLPSTRNVSAPPGSPAAPPQLPTSGSDHTQELKASGVPNSDSLVTSNATISASDVASVTAPGAQSFETSWNLRISAPQGNLGSFAQQTGSVQTLGSMSFGKASETDSAPIVPSATEGQIASIRDSGHPSANADGSAASAAAVVGDSQILQGAPSGSAIDNPSAGSGSNSEGTGISNSHLETDTAAAPAQTEHVQQMPQPDRRNSQDAQAPSPETAHHVQSRIIGAASAGIEPGGRLVEDELNASPWPLDHFSIKGTAPEPNTLAPLPSPKVGVATEVASNSSTPSESWSNTASNGALSTADSPEFTTGASTHSQYSPSGTDANASGWLGTSLLASQGSSERTGQSGEVPAINPIGSAQIATAGEEGGNAALTPAQVPSALVSQPGHPPGSLADTLVAANSHGLSSVGQERALAAWQSVSQIGHIVNGATLNWLRNGAEMRIQLRTDAFGPMEIQATLSSGKVGAAIGVESTEAQKTLLNQIPALQQSLADRHLELERISIVAGPNQGGSELGSNARQDGSDLPPDRRFLMAIQESERISEPVTAPRGSQPYGAWGRLNVRA